MTLFTTLVIFGVAVLGFFLLVDGFSFIAANTGDRGESRVSRRLFAETHEQLETRIESIAREERAVSVSSLGKMLDGLILKSASNLSAREIFLFMLALSVVFFGVYFVMMPWLHTAFVVLLAIGSGMAAPIFYLQKKAAKRVARFQEQLPDALDLVVRSLRIGHPLSAALSAIAEEAPAPLGPEFGIAARQCLYGKTPPEALLAMNERIDLADLRFFTVATQIHHESGGNLAEILHGLSKIIRSRFQLFRKVKALTVEGRFSAWFLSIFPLFMAFVMNTMQPGYYERVADYPYFTHIVITVIILLVINVIAMRMMTKLEV